MRVFITGATGFIGRHLCRRLVERGDRVVALVRAPKKARALLPEAVDLLEGDMSLFASEALVLVAEDERPASFAYFASHPHVIDLLELWSELGRAVGTRVRLVALPRWLLYLAMRASTTAAALFRFTNQLDEKQYRQITAPAFVCSSARLRAELGWQPRYDLTECVAVAADDYRAAGALRAPREVHARSECVR